MGLTDAWLKGNNGSERSAATVRGDRDGLGARVSPKGKITFQVRYCYDGMARRIDIGSYPLMSLKDARTEAIRLRARHEQGHDPKIVRLIERKSIAEAASVEDLVRAWYDAYCDKAKKGHIDFESRVRTIPPENHMLGHKTGKPLLRPIIPVTEDLLRQAFVLSPDVRHAFTNAGSDEPMGTSAPLAHPYNVMQWLRRHEQYDMAHGSVHDLRRTARTNFSTLTEPHVVRADAGSPHCRPQARTGFAGSGTARAGTSAPGRCFARHEGAVAPARLQAR